jgi:hypothetical protein
MTLKLGRCGARHTNRLRECTQLAALGLVLSSLLQSAQAAPGRFCGDPVESGYSTGTTQEQALLAAQAWWSSRAGALGRGYENWDHAGERAMECKMSEFGTFKCKAMGRPCLPPGMLPENVPKIEM